MANGKQLMVRPSTTSNRAGGVVFGGRGHRLAGGRGGGLLPPGGLGGAGGADLPPGMDNAVEQALGQLGAQLGNLG